MKVLDLLCPMDHAFEGWFASEEDFLAQQQRQLVQCPMCGSGEVRKALSAPRLNLRGGSDAPSLTEKSVTQEVVNAVPGRGSPALALQAAWLELARKVMASTEDVGERFASEARRMHREETPERTIRGKASAQETAELLEEGIAVFPLLLPDAAKNTLQ